MGKMPSVDFPLPRPDIRGLVSNGRASVRIPLKPDEKLYRLGLQFQRINRRGRVYHLQVDHYSSGTDRTHAPLPFYISSDGYGVLFNSARSFCLLENGNIRPAGSSTLRHGTGRIYALQ